MQPADESQKNIRCTHVGRTFALVGLFFLGCLPASPAGVFCWVRVGVIVRVRSQYRQKEKENEREKEKEKEKEKERERER